MDFKPRNPEETLALYIIIRIRTPSVLTDLGKHISANPFLLPVSGKRKKDFLLSCHSLSLETGRHRRPPIPRSPRLCRHCPLASVGDEHHLVFERPIFQPAVRCASALLLAAFKAK